MNYLAHSYLAFSDGQIVGQFLEDFIPNRDRFSFPPDIVDGIVLHRQIDTFTDAHAEIHNAKQVFRPLVRLYSGAFVDVAFDYFLANALAPAALQAHADRVYRVLAENRSILPPALVHMSTRMAQENWLFNYRTDKGIQFSMINVLNCAKYLHSNLPVFEEFLAQKEKLEIHFHRFFPELEAYCNTVNNRF